MNRDQRSARVAGVDGGVGLEELVVIAGDEASLGADYANRDGVIESEWVADRHYPLAYFDIVGIAQRRNRQLMLGFDLQECDVAFLIAPDQLGLVLISILSGDGDAFGIGDNVIVGHHVAVLADDKTRAETLRVRGVFLERTVRALPCGDCSGSSSSGFALGSSGSSLEILTTAGDNFAARSTKSGRLWTLAT